MRLYQKNNSGLTLLEIMIAAGVLVIAITGLLAIFTRFAALNENSRKLSLAITACQDKMEEIRDAGFGTIYTGYNGSNFEPAGFLSTDAEGAVYINNANPNLLQVYVSVSWRERSNRVIGEDTNLNGALDSDEDANEDNRLSSPAEIVTLICQR